MLTLRYDEYPSAADRLETIAPERGLEMNSEFRRCRECGTFYRYRHHYEYDATQGSWDEYEVWKLSAECQDRIRWILEARGEERDALLVEALEHEAKDVRAAAALLLWTIVDRGDALGPGPLRFCGKALGDGEARNFAYGAFLGYLRRGPEEARAIEAVLAGPSADAIGTSYAGALLREAKKIR